MHTGEYTFHTNTRQPHLAYREPRGWGSLFPAGAHVSPHQPLDPHPRGYPVPESNLEPNLTPLRLHHPPPSPLPPCAQSFHLTLQPHPPLPPSPHPPPPPPQPLVPRPSTEAQSECFVIIPPCRGASTLSLPPPTPLPRRLLTLPLPRHLSTPKAPRQIHLRPRTHLEFPL